MSTNIALLFIAERCDAGLHNCETIEYSENECHVKNVTTVMLMELEESMRANIQKVPEHSLLKDTELICVCITEGHSSDCRKVVRDQVESDSSLRNQEISARSLDGSPHRFIWLEYTGCSESIFIS